MSSPPRPPNRLVHETSPYLLQHAYNPVQWLPWGEEAFRKAREEDKPIFLSVGYSSCHWCHVMEEESFEDEDIARILNERFVPVKVDREERPDVDAIYMSAVQMISGSGGWPMSVFLAPDLKPFYGGTYFPPESRYGRIGFKELLGRLSELYRTQRGKVAEVSEELAGRLRQLGLAVEGRELPGPGALEAAFQHLGQVFDSTFGGFGGAPKFPHSIDLMVLLRHHRRSGAKLALDMALLTLRRMAQGGMYDRIGGGFHRYSVDRQWLVPHFEKMLYDNALLARVYLEAYQATGEAFFRRIAGEVLDYALRELAAPEGSFYSATDADSEGEEGKFFVWTPDQVEGVLGIETARLACLYYNITIGGNFEHGTSIPHVTREVEEIAAGMKMEPAKLEALLAEARAKLYAERERRVKPFRDEKTIAAWNGLMVSALARGYQATGVERYRQAAEKAARFLVDQCRQGEALLRIWKDGRARIPGFLDDYAYVAEGLLDLYEATFQIEYLEIARRLTKKLLADFLDESGKGFYYTAPGQADLIHRRQDLFDNATPSGNWVSALNLLRLERLTGEKSCRDQAVKLLEGIGTLLERAPMGFASALLAVDFLSGPPLEIAVLGDPASPSTREALGVLHRRFLPNKVLAGAPREVDAAAAKAVPLLAGKRLIDGKTTVYLCENYACKAPVTDLAELERELGAAIS
ncbi:MAG: thioredoxin domain-containing protein [Planctomycetes bacterium]|nr:thioredoxin domain-containing protein [Planctomycetota bacterium]